MMERETIITSCEGSAFEGSSSRVHLQWGASNLR